MDERTIRQARPAGPDDPGRCRCCNAHPDGMTTAEIARRVDSSVRTVYRDLSAIEGELGMPLWSEGGPLGRRRPRRSCRRSS